MSQQHAAPSRIVHPAEKQLKCVGRRCVHLSMVFCVQLRCQNTPLQGGAGTYNLTLAGIKSFLLSKKHDEKDVAVSVVCSIV